MVGPAFNVYDDEGVGVVRLVGSCVLWDRARCGRLSVVVKLQEHSLFSFWEC
jgi:hypothetical protein